MFLIDVFTYPQNHSPHLPVREPTGRITSASCTYNTACSRSWAPTRAITAMRGVSSPISPGASTNITTK